jgi:DNA-binding XRE family transcriptional regulator
MIKTDNEYKIAQERRKKQEKEIDEQLSQLKSMGISNQEVSNAMEPLLAFHQGLVDEVEHYENLKLNKRLDFDDCSDRLGIWLIELRIRMGLSQKEIADRMGISLAEIAKREYNDHYGIDRKQAENIFEKTINGEPESSPFRLQFSYLLAKPELHF